MKKYRVIWFNHESDTTEVSIEEAQDLDELMWGDDGITFTNKGREEHYANILVLDEDGNVVDKESGYNNLMELKEEKEPLTDEEKAILQHRWPTDEEKEAATDEEKEASFQLVFLSKSVKGQTLAEYQAASTGTHMDDE